LKSPFRQGPPHRDLAPVYNAQSVVLSALASDYNADGTVDAADYVVWRKNPGGSPDGYNTWRANFGQPSGSGSVASANATVPEPTTVVVLMFAAAGWYVRRHRGA
jgi:hypothetical protein